MTSSFGENERIKLKILHHNIITNFEGLGILKSDTIRSNISITLPRLNNIYEQLKNTFFNENFFQNGWIIYDNRNQLSPETYYFCDCLHRVMINKNNNQQITMEPFVRTLADKIFNYANYDMPPLMLQHNILQLNYQQLELKAYPDMLVENINKQIFCVVREDKHYNTSSDLKGDTQLAINMILSYIYNYKFFGLLPSKSNKIVGIKFISDEIEFITIDLTDNYIRDIISQRSLNDSIKIYNYKAGSLTNSKSRYHIFRCLEIIRNHIK